MKQLYNKNYQEEAENYQNYLQTLGYTKATYQARYLYLKQFFSWLESLQINELEQVIPKNIGREYVYVQLSIYIINFVMMAESRKTTMGHITTDHLKQSRIAIPPSDIVKEFCQLTKAIFEKQTQTSEETNNLLTLREFLLPILVSGQLDIWKKTTIS